MKFIANSAAVVGDVTLGENTSVWYSAVLRGDEGAIKIGDGSNIQDNCTVHGSVTVGNLVTVGHNAILHGCTVEDGALIGMGACILDGAVIGAQSLIGAGALVTGGTIIPPRSLVLGSPAKVKRELTEEEVASLSENAAHYIALAKQYAEGAK